MIKIINKVEDILVKILTVFGVLMLSGIVIIILANVVARYFFKAPFLWSLELCGILVVWLTFSLFGGCYAQKQHFCITAFDHLMSKKFSKILDWITRTIVFVVLIILWASNAKGIMMNGRMRLSSMPKVTLAWSAYMPLFIGIATYALFIIFDLIRLIAGQSDWEEVKK